MSVNRLQMFCAFARKGFAAVISLTVLLPASPMVLASQNALAPRSGFSIDKSNNSDGFIQSERGNAAVILKNIREREGGALQRVALKNYDAILLLIQEKLSALEKAAATESKPSRRVFLKDSVAAAQKGLARFKKIYESGQLYSFQAIVHGT